ncbi:MAG: hypothetical protein Q4B65_02210 [Candidatus Saccharibacteria bacterium]|nr:hypothetical protein [Candidatus Saccharibacteria bacterium]
MKSINEMPGAKNWDKKLSEVDDEFCVPVRLENRLLTNGLCTLGEVYAAGPDKLLKIRGLGETSVLAMADILLRYKLVWRDDAWDEYLDRFD